MRINYQEILGYVSYKFEKELLPRFNRCLKNKLQPLNFSAFKASFRKITCGNPKHHKALRDQTSLVIGAYVSKNKILTLYEYFNYKERAMPIINSIFSAVLYKLVRYKKII